MRDSVTLWGIVKKYYPYYKDLSVRNNVKYLSQSTMISDKEEQFLLGEIDAHHLFTVSNVEDGLEFIKQFISYPTK